MTSQGEGRTGFWIKRCLRVINARRLGDKSGHKNMDVQTAENISERVVVIPSIAL